jgi:chromate transporter
MESKSVSEPPTASEEFREIEVGDDDDPEHQSAANKASDDGNDDVGVGLTEHETETELDENNGADATAANQLTEDTPFITRLKAVIVTYAPLGFLAFGGPQAHVALLRDRLVVQEKWLDDEAFTELFAIGQGLPGPTSTQLVISTAMLHAGPIGGVVALFLFSLPGLIVLITCGVLIATFLDPNKTPWYLIGLPPAAISLVFQAFYGFGKNLDKLGIILCLISTQISLLIDGDETIPKSASQYVYPTMLAIGGIISYIDSRRQNPYGTYKSPGNGWDAQSDLNMKRIGIPLWVGAVFIAVWAIILVTTITIVNAAQREGRTVNVYLEIFELMYRVGTLVFGGGQVVLPMLGEEVVPGWMTES